MRALKNTWYMAAWDDEVQPGRLFSWKRKSCCSATPREPYKRSMTDARIVSRLCIWGSIAAIRCSASITASSLEATADVFVILMEMA